MNYSEKLSTNMGCSSAVDNTYSFIWSDGAAIELTCFACGIKEFMPHVITVPHVVPSLGCVAFYKCKRCNSLTAKADKFGDYLCDEASAADAYIPVCYTDYYLHVGAGIDSMVRNIQQTNPSAHMTLLDVGCGFGFTLDYWKEIIGGEGVGLEAGAYGKIGESLLGVTIYPKYLNEEIEEIKGRRFDRVNSSEVIEHTDDPLSFLRDIKGYLANNGVLILTTPHADFIQENNVGSIMLAALSPGMHRGLFSQHALTELLHKSGFAYHEVRVENEKLVAFASNTPLILCTDSQGERECYITYLRKKVANTNSGALGLGFSYRIFKELINDGYFEESLPIGKQIVFGIKQEYGLDVTDLDSCRETLLRCASFEEYTQIAPFFLPCFLFYAAMAARHGHAIESMDAVEAFACAAALCEDAQRVAPLFSQEAASLYWPAVFEEACAKLIAGDREVAFVLFERVQRGPTEDRPYLAYTSRPKILALRAMVQAGVAILQMNKPEEAMGIFRRALLQLNLDSNADICREAISLWKVARAQAEAVLPDWTSIFTSKEHQ
ncbi:class I SAM-dependent methyltransferase [Methylocaldum sp. 14B]|uniref:class I SAM-dependent methyltransferase n=1 Tax=Methylocaldum sp. 14B TaxID=1912213 RepID=UPI00098B0872|nr:class I SAM-dependent methyltransferase [Methylocaldum sp. 14B]